MPIEYMRDSWVNHKDYRDKYLNVLSGNHHYLTGYGFLPETSSAQSMQIHEQPNLVKVEPDPQLEEVCQERDIGGLAKKRGAGKSQLLKSPKSKKAKKATRVPKVEATPSVPRARAPRKSAEVVLTVLLWIFRYFLYQFAHALGQLSSVIGGAVVVGNRLAVPLIYLHIPCL